MFKIYHFCYQFIGIILLPFFFLWTLLHLLFRPGYFKAYLQRFGWNLPNAGAGNKPAVWVHAVSVGEVASCEPFIAILIREGYEVYLSTTTPTGFETGRKMYPDVHVFYYPLDYGFIIHRFLKRINPVKVFLVEMEFWPSFIYKVHKKGIPLYLVSGRLADKEFKNYLRFRFFFSHYLDLFSGLYMQFEKDTARMKQLTHNSQTYTSVSLKFDVTPPEKLYDIVSLLPEIPYILAASTHRGEEEVIIREYMKILDTHPHTALLIAPRHPHRAGEITAIAKNLRMPVTLRSENRKAKEGIFIIDTVGELMGVFPGSLLVIMGGTLYKGTGGHNIIEPALFGKCVVTGRYMDNFQDIFEAFVSDHAVIVSDPEILGITIAEILINPQRLKQTGENALKLVERNRGGAERLYQRIFKNSPVDSSQKFYFT